MRAERRVFRSDGTCFADDAEQVAAVFKGGMALLAEARAKYGLGRRDGLTAGRLRDGTVVVSKVRLAPPQSAADELAEARIEVLAARAAALPGGPR